MVNLNLQFDFQKIDEKDIDYTYLPESLKHTSISLSEISSNMSYAEETVEINLVN